MKIYTTPVAELLLLVEEDVLTMSDNALGDIFFEKPSSGETEV